MNPGSTSLTQGVPYCSCDQEDQHAVHQLGEDCLQERGSRYPASGPAEHGGSGRRPGTLLRRSGSIRGVALPKAAGRFCGWRKPSCLGTECIGGRRFGRGRRSGSLRSGAQGSQILLQYPAVMFGATGGVGEYRVCPIENCHCPLGSCLFRGLGVAIGMPAQGQGLVGRADNLGRGAAGNFQVVVVRANRGHGGSGIIVIFRCSDVRDVTSGRAHAPALASPCSASFSK